MTDTCSRNRLFTLPLLTLILFLSGGCQPAATGLAIENVTVVDPVAGVLPQQRVVVRGDQIVSVSDQAADGEAVAETVDGEGQFLNQRRTGFLHVIARN